jgi:hypothetical protein
VRTCWHTLVSLGSAPVIVWRCQACPSQREPGGLPSFVMARILPDLAAMLVV